VTIINIEEGIKINLDNAGEAKILNITPECVKKILVCDNKEIYQK